MARKKKGRPVNGILVLDKPTGITSNAALQTVKRLFQAQKAGHTGSLDPLATGVLPVCLGEATKVSHFLLDANKRYRARCVLGSVTTTGDSDGEVIDNRTVPEQTKAQLLKLLAFFQGPQQQIPPMFSALKYNGRPLYELARQGIEVERKSRSITIFDIQLLDFSFDSNAVNFIDIEVFCSKGTYIRTLCQDIGQAIGCGAHISALRRLESEPFLLSQAVSLEALSENFGLYSELAEADQIRMDKLLLPTDAAIQKLPARILNETEYEQIQHGHAIALLQDIPGQPSSESAFCSDNFRLYFNNTLIGLAILGENNQLKPKRLLFL